MNSTDFRSRFLPIEIRLDRSLTITDVGGGWDAFALANGGASLVGRTVVGKPLSSFIHGDAVRMFADVVFERVLRLGGSRTIRYRCDSPGIIREIEMTVTAVENGLLCTHRIVRETPTAYRARFKTTPCAIRLRCSHCNEIFSINGLPIATKDAGGYLSPEDDGTLVIEVDYIVCKSCRDRSAV